MYASIWERWHIWSKEWLRHRHIWAYWDLDGNRKVLLKGEDGWNIKGQAQSFTVASIKWWKKKQVCNCVIPSTCFMSTTVPHPVTMETAFFFSMYGASPFSLFFISVLLENKSSRVMLSYPLLFPKPHWTKPMCVFVRINMWSADTCALN